MAFDLNDPAQLLALKNEIINDPTGRNYSPHIGVSTGAIAVLLNEIQGTITVTRSNLPAAEFIGALDPVELDALTDNKQAWVRSLYSSGQIDTKSATVRSILTRLFPVGSTSRANLITAVKRSGSRAEQLFGVGTKLNHRDVAFALKV